MEFEILLTEPYTLDSIPNVPDKPDNQNGLMSPVDQAGRASPTHKCLAGQTT